jgi:hypothetical protein
MRIQVDSLLQETLKRLSDRQIKDLRVFYEKLNPGFSIVLPSTIGSDSSPLLATFDLHAYESHYAQRDDS